MKLFIITILLLFYFPIFGQISVEKLAKMPESISNNAIAMGTNNGKPFIYSFAGIDATKVYSGIHKKVYKYDVSENAWEILGELPSGNGRIASAASTVKNKIYVIGGYEVHENGSESSYNLVHVFNPETNTFEADGKPVPIPIDDHVQVVWRDSLIFVITGWSDNGNVDDVNIYNPSSDEWLSGDDVPGNSKYTAFGASGTIVGDTIYYLGGAASPNFSMAQYLRIGIINPNDPTDIQWSSRKTNAKSYRSASSNYNGLPIWMGGSDIIYNYDGIGYNGENAKPSKNALKIYHNDVDSMGYNDIHVPMDLRGIAKINANQYIICGGMNKDRNVISDTKLITLDFVTGTSETKIESFNAYPNPTSSYLNFESPLTGTLEFYNVKGQLVSKKYIFDENGIDINRLPANVYFLHFVDRKGNLIFKRKIVKK